MKKRYPIAIPVLNGNEKKYVTDCLDSTWISSNGSYIERFEQGFCDFCDTKHAISCSNGTTALHLALMAHGVERGDEVIIPTLTFVATANAVNYCGATPVFIDSEPDTWNINPELIETKITPRTKGIIVVHIYGHPVNMDPIMDIAQKHGLFVIEDAAEALGAEYKGKMIGSIGHSATFSLFGNKIITTGEGGMITTNDDRIAQQIRLLKGQGQDPQKRYWFPVIGYNYRMTNIQAAVGYGQLENIDWHVDQRIRVAKLYEQYLQDDVRLTLPVQKDWARNVFWMSSIILNKGTVQDRDHVMIQLKERGIETRPFFYPMHMLPPYKKLQKEEEFPVVNRISALGMNVPSYGTLSEEDVKFICMNIKEVLDGLV
ncbi:aminotransferase DegT [Paenibacillus selenitireducens]|uniref:Aminotransferase DegT n=1 Tax=Paenibacillus selenitireducens TaxID=1324314 RepID=A0A1T2XK10_9BACL|nr:DegT/DnrJ/EryC1/StrS family aminotransferase [Paenibacillus selenitireducens]OPA80200.1 aminotransferase DegT [Paenibacillus selenitireducens]